VNPGAPGPSVCASTPRCAELWAKEREAASTSEVNRFETEILTTRKNLKSLMDVPGKWIDRVRQHRALDKLILDLDSSVSKTYGRRERSG